jgi:hypothetical protein
LPLPRRCCTRTTDWRFFPGASAIARRQPGCLPQSTGEPDHLIRGLRLLTAVPLDRMQEFYCQTIELELVSPTEAGLTVRAGGTSITFVPTAPEHLTSPGGRINEGGVGSGSGEPFYHFAFNIPENRILAARRWQLERTALVPTPENLRDPAYPDDVRHFANWNAHSVFFFDPAYNVVEYIARHDLDNAAEDSESFGPEDLLYCSEIGFLVAPDDREEIAGRVARQIGLNEYPRGNSPWAMGDERGLLLVLGNLGGIWGENTDTPVRWGDWPTEATIAGPASAYDTFDGKPYRLHSFVAPEHS